MKISLAIICKADDAEALKLENALKTTQHVFDEICVTITGQNAKVAAVAEKYKAKVSHFDWVDDFAAARNFNFAQCTSDWIVWMDADDVFKGLEHLYRNVSLADQNNVTGLSMLYHYSHDQMGKVEDAHWKLQAVKAGHYEWRGRIHEDLLPTKPHQNASIKDVVRVHTASKKDGANSLARNLTILEKAVLEEPKEPRHYFYLARCYLATANWEGVVSVIETYLTLSNWKQERYDAMNMMGEAYMRLGDNDSAIKVHTAATLELEDAPDAYIYKARNYLQKEEWQNALTNLEIASQRDQDAVILKRSALYDHDLYLMTSVALMHLGEFERSVAAAERAVAARDTKKGRDTLQIAREMHEDEQLTRNYHAVAMSLMEEPDKVSKLLDTVPSRLKDDPRILQLLFTANPPTVWADNTVTIYCGWSVEAWDGNSVKNGGIGGSETAVIEIAKRLVKAGKHVTVYNRCEAEFEGREIDGVLYQNYQQFNRLDTFNVLWLWRGPSVLDYDIDARKIIVDMHDVSDPSVFTEKRLAQIDHVFVKSQYHKSLFPTVPEEKFVVVGNGIDLDRYFDGQTVKKNPHMFIYTSTPNRGLENILDVWKAIRDNLKDAELHVFYGWNTFFQIHKDNPAELAWMETMQQKMQQVGIVDHGRVDQATLAEYQRLATFWLYPTEFPEIHCITALEMQAAGVYPITTGFGALAETQQSGLKLPGDPKTEKWRMAFLEAILKATKDDLSNSLAAGHAYVAKCSWDNVTDIWLNTMN